jgi:hypothetical protein
MRIFLQRLASIFVKKGPGFGWGFLLGASSVRLEKLISGG